MTVIRFANNKYTGTDIDTKPTNVPAGSEFITDTGNIWIHDGADWELLIAPSTYAVDGDHVHDASTDITTGTLPVTRGGTNKGTITEHSILKGGAANAYEEIAPSVTDGDVLKMVAGTPAWAAETGGGGAVTIDDLTDVDTATVAPANNDVLTWNSTDSEWVPAEPPGATGGEANTGANVGTGEGGIFRDKTSITLNLKTIKAGTNITVTNNTDDITIASSGGSITSIADAEDVTFTSLTNGDVMEYNSGTLDWENVVHDHSAEFAALAHDHDADYADIAHDHDLEYSDIAHHHDAVYSALAHNHDADYADIVHDHDADYADIVHDHDADYSALGHVHSYASITDKPTEFTPEAHVHSGADITSGTVPIAQLPVANETEKGIAELATSGEVTAGLVVQASDTRLSDSRTPTTHAHSGADITSGEVGATFGGTGKATFTQHALLKGGASNAYSEIAIGSTDQVLAVVAGTPAWKSLDSQRVGKSEANGNTTSYSITHGLGSLPNYVFCQLYSHGIAISYTFTSTVINITTASVTPAGTNNVKFMWTVIA